MNTRTMFVRQLILLAGLLSACAAWGQGGAARQNSIDALGVTQQGGDIIVKLTTSQPLSAAPGSFSVSTPPRIAFDFPATTNALGRNAQIVNEGDLRSVNIVQVGERTRVVLNLRQMHPVETRVEGRDIVITLKGQTAAAASASAPAIQHFAEAKPSEAAASIRDINFRRGKAGEARIIVDLSEANVGIDIRQQGPNLVVDFLKASVPDNLRRRLDVTDFATPVTTVNTLPQGDNVRMIISPKGLWEHTAYQSDNQFVVEVKPVVEDPNKLVQGSGRGYQGEKLSLNFQNIDVRSVLQVIADFTDFNIITSDTVGGNLTLRLKDVPWDQALDIILQAKGLDMRKNGNVIWIAPRDELAAREKLQLESRQQVTDLEPTRTETFQLSYQSAANVQRLLSDKTQPILSKRGSAVSDARTNKLFVHDVSSRLEDARRLIGEIDVPTRQVLIEARIVEADDNFSRNLGVRLGYNDNDPAGHRLFGQNSPRFSFANFVGTQLPPNSPPILVTNPGIEFNNPASSTAGNVGKFNFILFNSTATRVLNLELTALEADGRGKIISSPRVATADKVEALIEDGVEIPYQQATSSGATSVSFRKATLALKVIPHITPDGRVKLVLDVNKDSQGANTIAGPAINTKHVKTEVLVENGGTVVIGGIYRQEEHADVTRIPFLGDLPYVGFLFKNTATRNNKTELLVFITPKVLSETLSVR